MCTKNNNSRLRVMQLVAWHRGRTPVFRRRTFPVLQSTCSWWVTTIRYKSTNQANSAFHPFRVDKWLVSWNYMCATSVGVATSGECLRRHGSCEWQVKLCIAIGPYLSTLEMRFMTKYYTNRRSYRVGMMQCQLISISVQWSGCCSN